VAASALAEHLLLGDDFSYSHVVQQLLRRCQEPPSDS